MRQWRKKDSSLNLIPTVRAKYSSASLNNLFAGLATGIFFFCSVATYAEEDARNRLYERLIEIKTYEADFVQQSHSEDGARELTQRGRIAIERPGKFLWVVTEPFEQHVVMIGEELTIYDPDLEQLTKSKVETLTEPALARMLSSPSIDDLNAYHISQSENNFVLQPKSDDALFIELRILFHDKTIDAIEVVDHFQSKTEFNFSNTRLNLPIEPETFHIKVPPGTELILGGVPHSAEP